MGRFVEPESTFRPVDPGFNVELGAARDGIGQVVAWGALLVVGAVAPGGRFPGGREAAGVGRGGGPAVGVALGRASRHRAAVAVEAGGGAEAAAEQEAGD